MSEPGPRVYLSYSAGNPGAADVAARLRAALMTRGVSVIDATKDLAALGEHPRAAIERAISSVDAVVCVLFEDVSPWVEYEAAVATASNKQLFSLFMEPSKKFGDIFTRADGVHLSGTHGPEFAAAIERIASVLANPSPASAPIYERLAAESAALKRQRLQLRELTEKRSQFLVRGAIFAMLAASLVALVLTFGVTFLHVSAIGESPSTISDLLSTLLPTIATALSTAAGYYFGRLGSSNERS